VGKVDRHWQDCQYVLSYFGKGRQAQKNYLWYVEQGIPQGRRPALVGGGLIRSLGGWSAVLALRSRGQKQASDTRILGDSGFVQEVTSDFDDLVKKNLLRLSGRQVDIATLAKRVCKKHEISLDELCSGSRRRVIAEARVIAILNCGSRVRLFRGRRCTVSWSHQFMRYEVCIIWEKNRREGLH